jgi:TonB family protein
LIFAIMMITSLMAAIGWAQQPVAPVSNPPTDPKELLSLAARLNGLSGGELQPWHIKISFATADWNGVPAPQGTFEEIWAGPTKYRRTFATTTFGQVEYGSTTGPRRLGNPDAPPPELLLLVDQLLNPIPSDSIFADKTLFELHEQNLGSTKLDCITATRNSDRVNTRSVNSTFCLTVGAPILRITLDGGGLRLIRNGILKFQNRYLAQDIEEYVNGTRKRDQRPTLAAHLETMELLQTATEEVFTAPPDAVVPLKFITLDEKVTTAQLLAHPRPVYPPIAEAARVSGDVVLSATIQTDGHVSKVRVVSGPAMLQQASIDAVKRAIFKPFLEDGQPVEVNTNLTIKFRVDPTRIYAP